MKKSTPASSGRSFHTIAGAPPRNQSFITPKAGKQVTEKDFAQDDPAVQVILALLQKRSGVDFRLYKMNTLKRRIFRRMLLLKISTLKLYAVLLTDKNDETDILFRELLINVTSFFRDPAACRYLKSIVLPRLLKNKQPDEPLRIWVPACSTGEEAYSLAIMILELQDRTFSSIPVQLFATDLNAQGIGKARLAVYSAAEVEHVSPKRLQRFFTRSGDGYRIARAVRDLCVFAPHNLLNDPPFSHIDLVSCCNLMIYFDTAAQKRAMATFHYALHADAYLLLSKTETIGASTALFAQVNKKFKVYLRKATAPGIKTSLPGFRPAKPSLTQPASQPVAENSADAIDALLLERFAPAGMVVNQQLDIVQFRGLTGPYLAHPAGKATLNVLKMVRPEIAFELRKAIPRAFKTKQPVRKEGIAMNGSDVIIALEVVPVTTAGKEGLALIVFIERWRHENGVKHKKTARNRAKEITAYEDELLTMSLQHEAAMEELQSANEEVVSTNEELRSINEELEASKETIQAANEKLAVFNQELQLRNEIIEASEKKFRALFESMDEGFCIIEKVITAPGLPSDFRYLVANPAFEKQSGVVNVVGQTIRSAFPGESDQWLETYDNIVRTGIPLRFERALTTKGRILELYAFRSEATNNQVAVIFKDITGRKMVEEALKENELRFRFIADAMPQKVWTAAPAGRWDYFNSQWLNYSGLSLSQLIKDGWEQVIHPDDRDETVRKWEEAVATGAYFETENRLLSAAGEYKWHLSRGEAYKDDNGHIKLWVGTNTEMQKQKMQSLEFEKAVRLRTDELHQANESLEEKNNTLKKINKELEAFAYVSSHDLQEPLRKIQIFANRISATESGTLSEKGKYYFDRMIVASSQMQALIEDLLAFARIKVIEYRPETIGLASVIEFALANFKEEIEEKKATVDVHATCYARIIPFQFQQLMHNLIGNSLKFAAPLRALHIRIDSGTATGSSLNNKGLAPQKKYCHISVTDNGIGFEQEFAEQIFDVFQRLHSKEDYPGTGIGLAIAKKIVENHHGVITATGEPGKGARFDIYLPE